MREIGIGDLVIMKSFFQRRGEQVLRVKGIGIVTDNKLKKVRNPHAIGRLEKQIQFG